MGGNVARRGCEADWRAPRCWDTLDRQSDNIEARASAWRSRAVEGPKVRWVVIADLAIND